MVFIHVYHSKAWLIDDYRDPALDTNITTTVTGAAARDPLVEPDPKISPSPGSVNVTKTTTSEPTSWRRKAPKKSFAIIIVRRVVVVVLEASRLAVPNLSDGITGSITPQSGASFSTANRVITAKC